MIWLRIAFWAAVCCILAALIGVGVFVTLACIEKNPVPCIALIGLVWFAVRLGARNDD